MDTRHHQPRNIRWLSFVFWSLMICSGGNSFEVHAADPVIDAARAKLYTARAESIYLLEEAVLQTPQRVDYWLELLRALETDSASSLVLRCYADAGLQANPAALPLLWEKARLVSEAAGYDELEKLERVEPDKLRIRDARQVLALGLRLPRDWNNGDFYESWAARAIRQPHGRDVQQIITRGLALKPTSEALRICQAMLWVRESKFEAAVALVKELNYKQSLQPQGVTPYPNVSDLLVLHKQPRLAVIALGTNPGKEVLQSRDGLLLGQALLLAGEVDQAEKVLEQTEPFATDLLVIANLLTLQKEAEAGEIANGLLQRLNTGNVQITRSAAQFERHGYWPVSLEPLFTEASRWLYAKYEGKTDLRQRIVPPGQQFQKRLFEFVSAAEKCTSLRNDIQFNKEIAPDSEGIWQANRVLLAASLRQEGLYREAAEQLRTNLLAQRIVAEDETPETIAAERLSESFDWQLMRLHAQALDYYPARPAELFAARQLLENLKATRWGYSRIKDQVWLADDEVVARASKLRQPLLAFVIEGLEPKTISGQDRTPWAQLVAKLGSKADVPALIVTLQLISYNIERHRADKTPLGAENYARDQMTLIALNSALEQLTGEKVAANEASDRVEFWKAWWTKNSDEILRGK